MCIASCAFCHRWSWWCWWHRVFSLPPSPCSTSFRCSWPFAPCGCSSSFLSPRFLDFSLRLKPGVVGACFATLPLPLFVSEKPRGRNCKQQRARAWRAGCLFVKARKAEEDERKSSAKMYLNELQAWAHQTSEEQSRSSRNGGDLLLM